MTVIYLITGFLGSGKTTFLNERLKNTTKKVGVLMNEFGKTSMDTITVQREGMSLLELTNGSIFCSCLKENFIKGLAHLVTLGLDEIYIESSGLSDPSDMGKVIHVIQGMVEPGAFEFRGTVCLIDGVFFKKELEKMVGVERQIKHSHTILINKTDLITEEDCSEIKSIIHDLNPLAHILSVAHGKINWDNLNLTAFPIEDEISTNTVESRPRSVLITFIYEPTRGALEHFLKKISQHFYRVKGFVEIAQIVYKIDQVNDQMVIVPFEGSVNTSKNELVCLSSQGVESISQLAKSADEEIAGLYRLKM